MQKDICAMGEVIRNFEIGCETSWTTTKDCVVCISRPKIGIIVGSSLKRESVQNETTKVERGRGGRNPNEVAESIS